MDYEELIELLRNDSECNVLDYIEDAATAIENLLAERRAAGWISVKDKLPEASQKVIAYLHFLSGGDVMDLAYYMGDDGWYYASWEASHYDCVTHWMPLPAPPEEDTP